jgi:hypothetical protein
MGTDMLVGSWRGTDWRGVAVALIPNQEHLEIMQKEAPEIPAQLTTWSADDTKLRKKLRAKPELDSSGKIKNLALLNVALHQYSKGLDNLVQMLADAGDVVDLTSLTLHVIGSVGPYQDYNQYLNYFLGWYTQPDPHTNAAPRSGFQTIFHGKMHPQQIDSVVESIQPHAYIHGSQGETGPVVAMEALIKGFPIFMQDHPFRKAVYPDGTPGVFPFLTAKDLSNKLRIWAGTSGPNLTEDEMKKHLTRYGIKNTIDDIERALYKAIGGLK